MHVEPLGDSALIIRLGDRIDESTHLKVSAVAASLAAHPFPGFVELVPAFTTVAVYYDPVRASFAEASRLVTGLLANVEPSEVDNSAPVEIPVCYGGDLGPDLEFVAKHSGLSPEEVIKTHAGGDYRVYMIGFSPGFPFMGGLPGRISVPRRSSPRLAVPAGSVGIAGMQTGVYPIETPGGWQIIGRTRLALFRPDLTPPTLLHMGSRVRFKAISREAFRHPEPAGRGIDA